MSLSPIKKKYNACGSRKKNTELKDQFYTKERIMKDCLQCAANAGVRDVHSFLDFSAGNNQLIELMKTMFPEIGQFHAYDIDPHDAAIVKQDFLTVDPFHVDLVGFNPPFGLRSCLAKAFLLHAAQFTPKFIIVIIPVSSKCIYPNHYRQIFQKTLPTDAFFIPFTIQQTEVKNCQFVVLQRDETCLYAIQRKEKETPLPGIRRFLQSTVPEWTQEFTQGFAVRRTGTNAGRHALIWHNKGGVFMDKEQRTHPIKSFVDHKGKALDFISFFAYQTDFVPTVEFLRTLWMEFKKVEKETNSRMIPCLDSPTISKCIWNALELMKNRN